MMHYAKVALTTTIIVAIIFRVAPLRQAVTGIA
jgi:hypothetical protein